MPMPGSPSITVVFSGLLLVRLFRDVDERLSCDVGVNIDPLHQLAIGVIRNDGAALPVPGPFNTDIVLQVTPDSQSGVSAYLPYPKSIFHRADAITQAFADPQDLKWAVDFAGDEFHAPHDLQFDPAGIKLKIKLTQGSFFTWKRSSDSDIGLSVGRSKGTSLPQDFGIVAIAVAANIYLNPNDPASSATLIYGAGPNDRLPLPVSGNAGGRYTMYISNMESATPTGDFRKQYNAILLDGQPVPFGDRFELSYRTAGKQLLNTPRLPCSPGLLGGAVIG